jgi:putative transcriptional regulator
LNEKTDCRSKQRKEKSMLSLDASPRGTRRAAAAFITAVMTGIAALVLAAQSPAGGNASSEDPDSPGIQPARGKLLVAGKGLTDPRFQESVVLLIEYGPRGATGLIINHPTTVQLSTLLPSLSELKKQDHVVYYGGPVDNARVLMLIRSDRAPAESAPVFKGVYISSSWKALEEALGLHRGERDFRAYSGYAGWAAGQLEREIGRGDWFIVPADIPSVFAKKTDRIWRELYRRGSEIQVRGSGGPRFAALSIPSSQSHR